MKSIAILGSTGSIGVNTLDIVRTHPKQFSVKVLAAKQNAEKLYEQAKEFRPELVCLYDHDKSLDLEKKLKRLGIRLVTGADGLIEASQHKGVDTVVFAIVGAVGLLPLFSAVRANKAIAVANKEPLVMAGGLFMKECKDADVPVFPIDSEHASLWQCMEGYDKKTLYRLILTSSGGPFRNTKGSLQAIKPREALKHPCWKMGPKITIDSATLMNKGLEVIEAANLFDVSEKQIDVVVHPEAIVHAMVEFQDGSYLAHLSTTDMRLPIQYALSYPERLVSSLPRLDLAELGKLHFEKPNRRRFPCLDLGYEASRLGGSMPAVLNAANEVAVQAFLDQKIGFLKIPKTIERVMQSHKLMSQPSLSQILDADQWAREEATNVVAKRRSTSSKKKVKV